MKVVFSQVILDDQWDILYRFVLRMMGNSISKMSYSLGYQVKTPQLILAFLPKPIYGGKARLTEKEISKANRLIPLLGMVYIRVISRMRQEIFLSI